MLRREARPVFGWGSVLLVKFGGFVASIEFGAGEVIAFGLRFATTSRFGIGLKPCADRVVETPHGVTSLMLLMRAMG